MPEERVAGQGAVAWIGGVNLAVAWLIAVAGFLYGVLGAILNDNPHLSRLRILGTMALVVVVPLLSVRWCRTQGRRKVAEGEGTLGMVVTALPSPFLIFAVWWVLWSVFYRH